MSDTADYGSGLSFGEGTASAVMGGGPTVDVPAGAPPEPPQAPANMQASPPPTPAASFGSALRSIMPGPNYRAPDPQTSALDQTADTLQQRIERANSVATNPMLQFFNPEGVQKARDFIPAATEKLQAIKAQKAAITAGRTQAETLGLNPGEVADEASMADRVEAARSKALKGDLRVFKGLQSVDPKAAEAIQDQVYEVVGGHLNKAQFAFDSLAGMQNQGQYTAKLQQLRNDGSLGDLEAMGIKIPPSFDTFNGAKGREAQALRDARIGLGTVRQRLEERNTYQPMEKKEAETYSGRMTTVHGDQITNGTWGRNASSGVRGLIVNGAADPRELGKSFTLATPEQRKGIREEAEGAVPKAEIEKARAFDRTYDLATKVTTEGMYDDGKGGKVKLKKGDEFPPGAINTNPNVQQGIAEGLASMLRGGTGGANVGLLQIETNKRGVVQGVIDSLKTAYAGGVNTLSAKEIQPYLTKLTQQQQRDVLDGIKQYNDAHIDDRIGPIARRAGALGLDTTALGWGKDESEGVVSKAIEQGRLEQIARMTPNHRAIGGGDGAFLLGAQRPGAEAAGLPAGTAPTTQLPGAPAVQTPVQQAQNPNAPAPPAGPNPGGAGVQPPAATPVQPGGPSVSPPAGPAGGAPASITIAGQQVNTPPLPPGASPQYFAKTQRIESGNEKDPWKAGNDKSSASGAWQFINSTWAADKPPGAPDKARDATPQQQIDAAATRATKNAAALTRAGVPVNDVSLYVAHNLGEGAGPKLLTADPNADARTVVGKVAANNNPLFFRGNPTVAKVLERYAAEVNNEPPPPKSPLPGSAGATAEAGEKPGLMTRVSRMFMAGIPDDQKDKAAADVRNAAVEHAPAIGSVVGGAVGSLAGPAGTIAGGGAGGGAGQSLKDYLQGRDQSPSDIAKQTALGGVLGVASAARPVLATAARVGGAGAVEGTAAAVEGKDAGEIADATLKGSGAAAGGELFGRALGMVGHKVFNMFAPDAKKAVQEAAGKYAGAEATLAKEAPTLPSVNGVAGGKNPVYLKAEADKLEAERVLKDAGLKPDEAAYAHKVVQEGVPKGEATVARPGALEKDRVAAGYQQLEGEVGAAGKGAPKASPKLADGPIAAVESKRVSAKHEELATRTEMAITAPAANFQEKWVQLKDARSALLQAERDALSSTAPGRTREAKDMRELADTVRAQQEKVAKYVFGEKDGAAFMARLKVLDVRYRNLMEATNGGELAKAAALKGDAGREAEKKFVAFAHDDPAAVAAYRAMRRGGSNIENDVRTLVGVERIPYIGAVVSWGKMAARLREWAQERAAGSPVSFADLVKTDPGRAGVNQAVRDVLGSAAQRGAVMQ